MEIEDNTMKTKHKVKSRPVYKSLIKAFGEESRSRWAIHFSTIVADAVNNAKGTKEQKRDALRTHLLVDASVGRSATTKFINQLKKDGII
jgi:hypothetical protein